MPVRTMRCSFLSIMAACSLAVPRLAGEASPIRHVVVIFQENVSFDHYFGTYPNAANDGLGPNFTAKPGTPLVSGLFPNGLLGHNPNSVTPFRLTHAQAITCDQDHNYGDEQKAFDGGAMDKFPETVGTGDGTFGPCFDAGRGTGVVMGYLRRQHRDCVVELLAGVLHERQLVRHHFRAIHAGSAESGCRADLGRDRRERLGGR